MTDAMLAGTLGAAPVARRRIERGYTPAERWVVQLDDGRSAFVKLAVNELTSGWLRDEHRIYAALQAPFVPRMLAWAPGPLLSTGVLSEAWLAAALPALMEASDACALDGDAPLHLDVRSDNLCFRADGSAVLVDWNNAVVGNPRLDIAAWLPTLVAEGGPPPEALLPDAGPEAAFISGFFAARAGQPIPDAPAIRRLELEHLRRALPWACRALGLPLP